MLATRTTHPELLELIRSRVDRVEPVGENFADDADRTAAIAEESEADWIVLDGYHFNATYRERVQRGRAAVLCVDDHGSESYTCDIVVNGNLYAADRSFSVSAHTQLLAGPTYAILRPEFRAPARPRNSTAEDARILVTLGGSDAGGHVADVLALLAGALSGSERVRVIVGPAADPRRAHRAAATLPVETTVEHAVEQMAPHMQWANRCITAAGSICLEYARMGVPMAAGIVADNQVPVARSIESLGLGVDLGWLRREPADSAVATTSSTATTATTATTAKLADWLRDREALRCQAAAGPRHVDGNGALRIADRMLESRGLDAHA